jgi:acyl-coenzyme A thioesterase PaaI-like protein
VLHALFGKSSRFPQALGDWLARAFVQKLSQHKGFDGRLAGFTVTHVSARRGAEGASVCGTVPLHAGLMSRRGAVDGGAIAFLADSLTTVALMAQGALPGVSAALSYELMPDAVAATAEGAVLEVEARVLKAGRNLGFTELRVWAAAAAAAGESEGERRLLAIASHTKYLGGAPLPLAWAFALANFAPGALLALGSRLVPITAGAPPAKVREADGRRLGAEMGALLRRQQPDGSTGVSGVSGVSGACVVTISRELTNLYGAAHGAALAALMAQSAELEVQRTHPARSGHDGRGSSIATTLCVRSSAVDYLSPVRAKKDAEIAARLVNSAAEQAAGTFVAMVEVRSAGDAPAAKRPVLTRAKIVLQACV